MKQVEQITLTDEQVRALQAKNLEIAKYFAAFCRENGVKFFLTGGSCLGAIRHQGFIPWDDDIDLFMLAPDFEKLKEVWPRKADTARYSLCYETRDYNDHHLTPTVRDNNTTFITKETWDRDVNQGVALEIGILNACPESAAGQKLQLILAAAASLFKAQRLPNRQSRLVYNASRVLLGVFRSEGVRYFLWNTSEKIATVSNRRFSSATYVREFTMFPYIRWLYPREWFDEAVDVPFEDTMLPVPKGSREYLEKRYGNYMELPPEKDRHPEHRVVFMDLERPYTEYRGKYYYVNQ